MIVLMVTIGVAIDCSEPGARNSKRLPVKAKGLVRLRSPGSVGSAGQSVDPDLQAALFLRRGGTALGDLIEDVGQLVPESR